MYHPQVLACRAAYHEDIGAEAQRALGMELHQLVAARAQQQGGHLAQRLADGWTVLFNYPNAIQGAEERACGLALALVGDAQKLPESRPHRGAVTLYIGVHAAVSVLGTEAGGELLAQGEAPTCALSLQGLAGANQVLLSSAVQEAACSRFTFRESAAAPLRTQGGQRQTVHELVGAVRQVDAASAAGKQGVLVGRDAEVGHLLAVISSTQEGAARMVLLTGAAGTGKSALVRHVLAQVAVTEYKVRRTPPPSPHSCRFPSATPCARKCRQLCVAPTLCCCVCVSRCRSRACSWRRAQR